MSKEKIYFEEGNISVTESRVVLGDDNFVLRNISAVKVAFQKRKLLGYALFALCLFWCYDISTTKYMGDSFPRFEPNFGTVLFLAGAVAALYFLRDNYFVEVSSGGTPSKFLKSEDSDLPSKVVDAINNALLDLDKKSGSDGSKPDQKDEKGNDSADEVMKLKGLLDAGAITQEEFDTKKKELLGL